MCNCLTYSYLAFSSCGKTVIDDKITSLWTILFLYYVLRNTFLISFTRELRILLNFRATEVTPIFAKFSRKAFLFFHHWLIFVLSPVNISTGVETRYHQHCNSLSQKTPTKENLCQLGHQMFGRRSTREIKPTRSSARIFMKR